MCKLKGNIRSIVITIAALVVIISLAMVVLVIGIVAALGIAFIVMIAGHGAVSIRDLLAVTERQTWLVK